jgi:hypothetical protein
VKAAGEARLSRKKPKSAAQLKADKRVREQKAAERERKEHELQSFARTLVEKFEGCIPQLLTWLDEFPNTATAKAIRQIGIDNTSVNPFLL